MNNKLVFALLLAVLIFFVDIRMKNRPVKRFVLNLRAKIMNQVNNAVSAQKLNVPNEEKKQKSIRRASNLTRSDKFVAEMEKTKQPANATERLEKFLSEE